MNIFLSAFAPENLVSRDGFGSPVPRQPANLHTQAESGAYGIPPEFRGGVHLFSNQLIRTESRQFKMMLEDFYGDLYVKYR